MFCMWCRRWPQLFVVMAAQQTRRVSCVFETREKKCKNITDKIFQNHFHEQLISLNSSIPFYLQIRHWYRFQFEGTFYTVLVLSVVHISGDVWTPSNPPHPQLWPPGMGGQTLCWTPPGRDQRQQAGAEVDDWWEEMLPVRPEPSDERLHHRPRLVFPSSCRSALAQTSREELSGRPRQQ